VTTKSNFAAGGNMPSDLEDNDESFYAMSAESVILLVAGGLAVIIFLIGHFAGM
jgi:hypothetical protein